MTIRIGIDTGGTFTDVVAFDEESGAVHATKTPSEPSDPSLAFAEGLRLILSKAGAHADDLTTVSHGTTVATNALLEDDITGLGLLTTKGFRHVLVFACECVPVVFGYLYFWGFCIVGSRASSREAILLKRCFLPAAWPESRPGSKDNEAKHC